MNQIDFPEELTSARQRLKEEAKSMVELRPLPAIALKVNRACADKEVDIKSLTSLVECDAAFASKILSVVNSSIYGYMREISSIRQALVILGRMNIGQLATSIAAQTVFCSSGDDAQARLLIYEHSLGCAAISRVLAGKMGVEVDPSAAFLAGMLHDVGKLILLDLAPQSYAQILNANAKGENSVTLEQAWFETDHTELGKLFGDSWGLSQAICHAISQHHNPSEAQTCDLTRVTQLANQLSKTWGVGQPESEVEVEWTDPWLEGCDEEELETVKEMAMEQFAEVQALLVS